MGYSPYGANSGTQTLIFLQQNMEENLYKVGSMKTRIKSDFFKLEVFRGLGLVNKDTVNRAQLQNGTKPG